MEIYYNKIKGVMDEKQITSKAIAKETGLREATISRLINAEYLDTTQFSTVMLVADCLNVKVENIFVRKNDIREDDSSNQELVKRVHLEGKKIQVAIMKKKGFETYKKYNSFMTATINKLLFYSETFDKSGFIEKVSILYISVSKKIPDCIINLDDTTDDQYRTITLAFTMGLMSE